jgi:hypothetical protein
MGICEKGPFKPALARERRARSAHRAFHEGKNGGGAGADQLVVIVFSWLRDGNGVAITPFILSNGTGRVRLA